MLVTNEMGDYGFFDEDVIERIFTETLTMGERSKLTDLSILIEPDSEWRIASLKRRLQKKFESSASKLSYLIVVPTLRCNLSCGYCQVSRAPLSAKGFDWTDSDIDAFEAFLINVDSEFLKLEFQGGEPTVRPDLLNRIMDVCERNVRTVEFAICTNLLDIDGNIEAIFERDNVYISTSVDGPTSVMTANRTGSDELSKRVLENIDHIMTRYGTNKVSALPTVTDAMMDNPDELIDLYVGLGFGSIFLRPVNYMGFARKRYSELSREYDKWERFYERAIEYVVELNRSSYFEEYYLALLVRSIFGDVRHGFVDFQSPSRFLSSYCVIDFDGTIYPTDEARMLSRTRHVDLSVGNMRDGVDREKVQQLNFQAVHHVHEDCVHCAYMPYCGIDVVDDLSRYGRVDVAKHDTWFCRRQTSLFDMIFEKVASYDAIWLRTFENWIFREQRHHTAYELFE